MKTTTKFDPEEHSVPQVTELTPITSDKEVQTLEIYYMNSPEHYSEVEAPDTVEELEDEFTHVADLNMDADREHTENVFRVMQGEHWSNSRKIGEQTHEKVQDYIKDSETAHTSMSAGDLIKVAGYIYLVEMHGFTKLHVLKSGRIVTGETLKELDEAERGY